MKTSHQSWCVKRKSGLWPRKRQMEGKSANGDSLLWWPLVLTTYWVWVMASSDLLLRPPGCCGSIWTQRRLSPSNISVPTNSFLFVFKLDMNGVIQSVLFCVWLFSTPHYFCEIHPSCCTQLALTYSHTVEYSNV